MMSVGNLEPPRVSSIMSGLVRSGERLPLCNGPMMQRQGVDRFSLNPKP